MTAFLHKAREYQLTTGCNYEESMSEMSRRSALVRRKRMQPKSAIRAIQRNQVLAARWMDKEDA